ncbi:hypothetical protein RB653_004492 [Dictyostelium firmibasis]|uniref:GAIN-B domain-containing protein n=1 Tax=Dictyostelium firmibasis TaxID=79012 RepID=A0AAN7UJF2_9MYCE
MLNFIVLFILLLLCSPSFQVDLKRGEKQQNIYKNYDISILKKEYESIIRDYNINNVDYEKDLSNIYTQLNNIQFSNITNFNNLDWFLNLINNQTNINSIENNNGNNEKLNIGIIVSSFEGMYSTSGIGTVYSILSDFLVKTGKYNVTVIYTRDDPPERKSFYNWKIDLKERGINLVHLPLSAVRVDNPLFVRKSYQVYQYLKHQSFDVLHFPDFEGMAYYSCLAKKNGVEKQFQNVTIVVGLHGPSSWVSKSNTKKISLDHDQVELDFMERKSVEMADIIWTPSNYIVSWLIKEVGWTIPQENLYLLPFLPPPSPSTAITNNKKTSSLIKEIVFFGRLEQRKGIVLFCDALDQMVSNSKYKQLSKLKVTFLGRSSDIITEPSVKIDAIYYIRDRSVNWPFEIKYLDEKSSNQAIEYLTDDLHKLVVIPSLEDNAPYTLYECLYNRIPFIASHQPSMVPLIESEDQSSVLFEINSKSLSLKLDEILVNGKHLIGRPTISKEKSESAWLNFYSTTIVSNSIKNRQLSDRKQNQEQPLVSICLTHFNRPNFLKQAIESIENQDYKYYEIVLVDDGSTSVESIDYLYSLKDKFKEKGWKIIMTENKYLGAARNTAASQAKGKYLLFLDDDNYMYPNAISTYVSIVANTNANVVSSPHSIFNSTDTPISKDVVIQRQWVPLGPSLSVGLFKNCFGDANFFIEKSSFNSIGGFTEEVGVGLEDHEILAKLVIEGFKLSVSTEPLLYYRFHDSVNQMIFNTDSKSNQMRYIRPFSEILSNGHVPVLKVLATNAIHAQSKRVLVNTCNITLSSVQPNYGPPSGGSLVSITGSGFNCGVSSVLFGGTACANPKVRTDGLLTCTTPSSDNSGPADIVVRGSDGSTITLTEAYNYVSTIAITSCALGANNGNFFSCEISDPVNTASSPSCSSLFSSSTLQTLGSSPTCEYTGSNILMVTLGTGESVSVGQQLEFLQGGITSKNGNKNNYQSVTLEPPQDATPVADIKAPNVLDSCSPLVLDASNSKGGNGKALTYHWSVSGGDTNTQLNNLLDQNNATITIPNNLLSTGQIYTFKLQITNWLKKSDTASVSVTKKEGAVLDVTIQGSSIHRMGAVDLTLKGNASVSSCSSDGASQNTNTIKYKWSIVPEIQLANPKDYTGPTLNIPASKWVYDTTYVITLTATSGKETNYDNVTVIISKKPITAVIEGGDKEFPLNTLITLDASKSFDPTVSSTLKELDGASSTTTQQSSFTYTWRCINKSGKDCGLKLDSKPTITFNSSRLNVGVFHFSVDVTPDGDATRSGSASTTVTIVNTPVIDVIISPLPATIDPTQKLVLYTVVRGSDASSSNLTFEWNMLEGKLELPLKQAYSTPMDSRNLVLKAGALGSKVVYRFSVDVKNKKTGATGKAMVTFTTEAIPQGGDITCLTTTGDVTDTYKITMGDQWTDNSGIKSYNFRYRVGSGPAIALSESSSDNSISTILPPGQITIIGYVTSNDGITASKSCKIQVKEATNIEEAINFLSTTITNPEVSLYQLSVALKIANSLVPETLRLAKASSKNAIAETDEQFQVIMPETPQSANKIVFSKKPTNPNQDPEEFNPPAVNKKMSAAAVASQISQFKANGIRQVMDQVVKQKKQLSNYGISTVVDLISTSTDTSAVVHPSTLKESMNIMKVVSPMMVKSQVLPSDFISSVNYLSNVNEQIVRHQSNITQGKTAPTYANMVVDVTSNILVISNSLADGILQRTASGEDPFTVASDKGFSITTFKTQQMDLIKNGQSIGFKKDDGGQSLDGEKLSFTPKFNIPSSVLSKKSLKSNSEISGKLITIPSNVHFDHKAPKDTTIFPKTVSLELFNGDSELAINGLKDPIVIDMGKHSPPKDKDFKCGWWDSKKLEWSTDGCSTHKVDGSIQCKCNHLTEFGLIEYAKSSQNIWIIIGPVVGGVVFAAAMVGTVVLVKRKKNKNKKNKAKKTKEQINKEKEDKKKQAREKKEADKLEKENKKKEKEDAKKQKDDTAEASSSSDLPIPKNKKDKSFGDENDVQYILQEFKDIFAETKKREQLKLLKNHQPVSPVTSIGNVSSTTSTPITSTVQPVIDDPSSSNTTTISANSDREKAAKTIQKAWKNYYSVKQLKKEAEVEELLENIGELLSDNERDPFETYQTLDNQIDDQNDEGDGQSPPPPPQQDENDEPNDIDNNDNNNDEEDQIEN